MTKEKIDFQKIFEGIIPKIQEENKGITHEEFATGVKNGTMGFKVMQGEANDLIRGFRKGLFNFVVFLYFVAPFIVIPILSYTTNNWWLLFGIGFSHIFTRFSAWEGSTHPNKWRAKIIYYVLPFCIGYWIFRGFHFFDYVTFYYFSSLWGHLFFQMAESMQKEYAMQMLVENPAIFKAAVESSKIMIIYKDKEDKKMMEDISQEKSMQLLRIADEKLESGDYNSAIINYSSAIEIYPFVSAYENRGYAKMKLNDYNGAIDDFSEAINRMPSIPDKIKFANIYHNRGEAKQSLQTSGTTNPLRSVYFTDANTGYAVGYYGTILKTNDAGVNWTLQTSGVSTNLYSVYFTDVNTGFAVGSNGTIINTIDAGLNWSTQASGTTHDLNSVYFTDINTGYAIGWTGTILKTSNTGSSWTVLSIGTNNRLNSVYFTDSNTGYVVGEGGTILKTTTGGVTDIIYSYKYENNIIISPNPNDGKFTIEFANSNKKNVAINISDLNGKIIIETFSTEEKYEFNVKNFHKGIYIIKVNGDKINNGKIVIQ